MAHSPGYSIHVYGTSGTVTEVRSQNGFSSPNHGFVWGGGVGKNKEAFQKINVCILYRKVYTYNFIQKCLYICIIFFLLPVVVLGEKF